MASRNSSDTAIEIRLTSTNPLGDRITLSTESDDTVLDLQSTTGIGRAELTAPGERWPTRVVMRLHLRGLESLVVSNGELAVHASVSSQAPYRPSCELLSVSDEPSSPATAAPIVCLRVRTDAEADPGRGTIPLQNGYFELRIPEELFSGDPETLFVQWIDFFRN